MTDTTARTILAVGLVVLGPIGLYYRLHSFTGEPLDRRQEGWFVLLTLRPLGIAFMLGAIAYLIDPQWMAWSHIDLPSPVRWFGVAIGAFAGWLLTWTLRSLGSNLTDTVATRRSAQLVTHGPYRWIRHPFYTGFALAVVAYSVVAANWYLALSGLGCFAIMVIRTPLEERKLVERFGEDYVRYMRATGRFLPRRPPL